MGLILFYHRRRNISHFKMLAFLKCLFFIGLLHGAMSMAAPARSYLPAPEPVPVPVIPSPQTTTSVISVTPTISETIWDFHTTVLTVVATRTQTQLLNIDVINTSWARTTVTVSQTATERDIAAVEGPTITTAVTSVVTDVVIETEVVPVRSTQVYQSTETVFETRTSTAQIYSQITHSKCELEVITVPTLVQEELTQTATLFVTNYNTQTLTVTTIVTVLPPSGPSQYNSYY